MYMFVLEFTPITSLLNTPLRVRVLMHINVMLRIDDARSFMLMECVRRPSDSDNSVFLRAPLTPLEFMLWCVYIDNVTCSQGPGGMGDDGLAKRYMHGKCGLSESATVQRSGQIQK